MQNIKSIENKFNIKIIDTYVNYRKKTKFFCNSHGYQSKRFDHLKKNGCTLCSIEHKRKNRLNEFIINSNKVHENKYDYSLVKYINNKTEVDIICNDHGTFSQRPDNHLSGSCCKFCNYITHPEDLIRNLQQIHNNIKFLITEYKSYNDLITCKCEIHGTFQKSVKLLMMGCGCNECTTKSKSEVLISNFLKKNDILHEEQKTFNKCKNKKKLRFDFYLSEYNICIEYDGIHHFESIEYFGGDRRLEETMKNDKIKNQYCIDNNILLFRISYLDNLEEKLNNLIRSI